MWREVALLVRLRAIRPLPPRMDPWVDFRTFGR
jgi:hypothetical protein